MADGRIASPHPAYLTVVLAMAGIEESSRELDAEDAPQVSSTSEPTTGGVRAAR